MRYRLIAVFLALGLSSLPGISSSPPVWGASSQEADSGRATLRLEVFCPPSDAQCLKNYSLLSELAPGITVARHTMETSPELAQHYAFSTLPATAVLQDGQFVGGIVGARSEKAWRQEIKRLVRAIDRGPLPSRASLLEATHMEYPSFNTGRVFALDLDYRSGLLQLARQRVFAGLPPKTDVGSSESYVVQLVDAAGKVLYARPFEIPLLSLPAAQEPSSPHPPPVVHTDQQVSLILPYLADAAKARLLRPYGVRALMVPLAQLKASADSVAPLRETRASAIHSTGDETDRLTILFMGDKYGSEAALKTDAGNFANRFLTTPPVSGRQNKINIYVDRTWDGLGCNLAASCVTCNTSNVMAAAAASGIAWDEVMVLVKTSGFFGCAGITTGGGGSNSYGRAYNGSLGKEVTTHELGHSVFGLMDEYVYDPPETGSSFAPNCSATCSAGPGNCFSGCTFTNLLRRTNRSCVMNSTPPASFVFGPACAPRAINVIDRNFTSPRGPAPPQMPALNAPRGNTRDAQPAYVWSTSSGAFEYELRLRDVSTPAVVFRRAYEAGTVCSSSTDRCRVNAGITLAAGTYRWFVRASGPTGMSNWVGAEFKVR